MDQRKIAHQARHAVLPALEGTWPYVRGCVSKLDQSADSRPYLAEVTFSVLFHWRST